MENITHTTERLRLAEDEIQRLKLKLKEQRRKICDMIENYKYDTMWDVNNVVWIRKNDLKKAIEKARGKNHKNALWRRCL